MESKSLEPLRSFFGSQASATHSGKERPGHLGRWAVAVPAAQDVSEATPGHPVMKGPSASSDGTQDILV